MTTVIKLDSSKELHITPTTTHARVSIRAYGIELWGGMLTPEQCAQIKAAIDCVG